MKVVDVEAYKTESADEGSNVKLPLPRSIGVEIIKLFDPGDITFKPVVGITELGGYRWVLSPAGEVHGLGQGGGGGMLSTSFVYKGDGSG